MSSIEEQYRNYSVAAILWNVYIISTTGLFLAQRRNDVIRKRSISCCMLQVICGIATSNSWLARVNFWPVITTHYPWIMIMIINYTFNLNWMLSYFLRTIILLNDYYTNRIGSILQRKSDIENVDELLRQLQPSRAELIIFNIQKRFFNEDSQIDTEKEYLKYDRGRILENRIGIKRNIGLRQVLKCTAVVTAVEVVLFLIVMGYSGGFSPNAIDPFFSAGGKEWMPIYAFVVLYLIAAAYFLYLLRNIRDSIYMKLEQILAISAFYPLFFLFIVTYFVRPVASIFWFGHNFWLFILLFITHTISIACPALYALLRQRGSEQKMILIAHNMDSFLRVLNNKDLFQKFKHILAEDFSIENALFWEEYNALIPSNVSKTTHTILDADAARRQVQYIVNTFILPGSPHELNLSAKTRKAIVQQATKNNYNTDILEPAKNEVIQLMYQNSYPRLVRRMSISVSSAQASTHTSQAP